MDASSMERVDALWFPDGNIVLCAHGVLFRVFRGILAARSPVFADMLAFPQPEDAETLDGCPVLHLDDSAADAMYFLKALFDYEFFAPYPAKTDFDAIHGVLRLGTKYRVGPLRRRALEHLASAHPMRLGEWDALCGGVLSLTTTGTIATSATTGAGVAASAASSASSLLLPSSSNSTINTIMTTAYAGPSFDYSHLELPILTLARAAGAAWVLPAAFLRAAAALTSGASLSSLDVLEGIDYTGVHVELERGDKVTLLESPGALLGEPVSDVLGFLWSPGVCPGCLYAAPSPTASTSSLSTTTTASSTSTTSTASGVGVGGVGSGVGGAGGGAGITNPCTANRLAMRVAAERWRADSLLPIGVGPPPPSLAAGPSTREQDPGQDGDGGDGDGDGMDETGEAEAEEGGRAIWGEEDFARLAVCPPCLAYMKADWAARRARFWERLPALFGLPAWEELERERERERV